MFKKDNRFSFSEKLPQKSISTPFYSVRYNDSSDKKLRVAIVVGKKVSPKAVIRNRIKRQVSSILEEIIPDSSHIEFILFLKKQILEISFEELKSTLSQTLAKIGIIEE